MAEERISDSNKQSYDIESKMTLREWCAVIISGVVSSIVGIKSILPGNEKAHEELEKNNARLFTLEKDDYEAKTGSTYMGRAIDELSKRLYELQGRVEHLESLSRK